MVWSSKRGSIPGRGREEILSLRHSVQTGFEVHPTCMGVCLLD
jgi:hypothetical protein